ncbi:MAG: Omp28-related outer membrane protein [Candidatus Eisenbacteria bacterium]
MLVDYSPVDVVMIRYHGDHPWEFDPFYLANPVDIVERFDYYSITTIPALLIDGVRRPKTCFVGPIKDVIDENLGITSPIKLVASDSIAGDSCFVDISVIAEQEPSADSLVLRAAVIEDSIYYEAPNTQDTFNFVFRDFVPDPGGIVFAIDAGETLDFELAFEVDPSWDPANISTIVFIQDETDTSIVQAVSSAAPPAAWARYSAPRRGDVVGEGRETVFPGTLISRGTAVDTFDVDFTQQLPPDWVADYEIAGGIPLGGSVVLERDSSCAIDVTIGCGYDPGTGVATLNLTSRRDPAFTRSVRFLAVSGVCALIVDDDVGYDLEHYYEDALDSLGISWGTWDRTIDVPEVDDLDATEFVIWFTGHAAPSLDVHDQSLLASYLAGDGRLFLTGQDIGWGLDDINSHEWTEESETFYRTYLHARHIMSNSSLWTLSGRAGDPITDGLSITIEGGDGADNQNYPDVIDSIAPAQVIFDYSDPAKHGGIRFDSDSSKVVYLSFGFEAISTPEDRVLLLSRIVNWFGGLGGIDIAYPALVVTCYPNPATSYAAISLSRPGAKEAVEIYDVLGRVVRKGTIGDAGSFNWNLRDSYGGEVAPGVYFVSVATNPGIVSRKIIISR